MSLNFTPVPKTIFQQTYEQGQNMRNNIRLQIESSFTTQEQAIFIPYFFQYTIIMLLNYAPYGIAFLAFIVKSNPKKYKVLGGLARTLTGGIVMFSGMILLRRRGLIFGAMSISDKDQIVQEFIAFATSYLEIFGFGILLLLILSMYGTQSGTSKKLAPQMFSGEAGIKFSSFQGKLTFLHFGYTMYTNWSSFMSLNSYRTDDIIITSNSETYQQIRSHLLIFPQAIKTLSFFVVILKISRDYAITPKDRFLIKGIHYLPFFLTLLQVIRLYCFGELQLLILGSMDVALIFIQTLLTILGRVPNLIDDRLKLAMYQNALQSESQTTQGLKNLQQRKMKQKMEQAFQERPQGNGEVQCPWAKSLLKNAQGIVAHEFYMIKNGSRDIEKIQNGLEPAGDAQ